MLLRWGAPKNGEPPQAEDSLVEIKDESGCEVVGPAKGVCTAVIVYDDAAPVFDVTEHDVDVFAVSTGRCCCETFSCGSCLRTIGLPPAAVLDKSAVGP